MRFAYAPEDPRADVRHVYFIEAVGVGLVKIGVANNARARLKDLDRMSPVPLRLLGVALTDKAGSLEKELHRLFAAARVRGEWFALTGEISNYVAERCSMPRRPVPAATAEGSSAGGFVLDHDRFAA